VLKTSSKRQTLNTKPQDAVYVKQRQSQRSFTVFQAGAIQIAYLHRKGDAMVHRIDKFRDFAMDVIHQAGEKAMMHYGKGRPHVKFDQSVVTEAELQLTDLFQNQLHRQFPEHQMFRYDQVNENYSHDEKRYLWIFDPLEGVANFQGGIPIWGMSIALLENFWPIFGVFHMPATGDLFHARASKDAFWGNEKIRISASGLIDDESLLLTYSRFHQNYRPTFPGKIRALGCTSAHICYVAMGRADAAIITNDSFQGLAAARVIIEAAGGEICKTDGSAFHLNEYLDGQRISDHLLVAASENLSQIRGFLKRQT
jgi:myo-inositol-1(or 4)-monophosphatase